MNIIYLLQNIPDIHTRSDRWHLVEKQKQVTRKTVWAVKHKGKINKNQCNVHKNNNKKLQEKHTLDQTATRKQKRDKLCTTAFESAHSINVSYIIKQLRLLHQTVTRING